MKKKGDSTRKKKKVSFGLNEVKEYKSGFDYAFIDSTTLRKDRRKFTELEPISLDMDISKISPEDFADRLENDTLDFSSYADESIKETIQEQIKAQTDILKIDDKISEIDIGIDNYEKKYKKSFLGKLVLALMKKDNYEKKYKKSLKLILALMKIFSPTLEQMYKDNSQISLQKKTKLEERKTLTIKLNKLRKKTYKHFIEKGNHSNIKMKVFEKRQKPKPRSLSKEEKESKFKKGTEFTEKLNETAKFIKDYLKNQTPANKNELLEKLFELGMAETMVKRASPQTDFIKAKLSVLLDDNDFKPDYVTVFNVSTEEYSDIKINNLNSINISPVNDPIKALQSFADGIIETTETVLESQQKPINLRSSDSRKIELGTLKQPFKDDQQTTIQQTTIQQTVRDHLKKPDNDNKGSTSEVTKKNNSQQP